MGMFDWLMEEEEPVSQTCRGGLNYLELADQLSRLKMIEQKARANADLCAVLCQKAEISYATACANTRTMEKLLKECR